MATCPASAVAAILCACMPAWAQMALPIAAPTYAPGDSWTLRVSDAALNTELFVQQVVFVERDGERLRFASTNLSDGQTHPMETDLNLGPCRTSKATQTSSCVGYLRFPLDADYAMAFSDMASQNGREVHEGRCRAAGVEVVEVPAGRFEALRIECKGFWSVVVGGNKTGRFDAVLWYAPAVRWTVKSLHVRYKGGAGRLQLDPDNKRLSELQSYRLGP